MFIRKLVWTGKRTFKPCSTLYGALGGTSRGYFKCISMYERDQREANVVAVTTIGATVRAALCLEITVKIAVIDTSYVRDIQPDCQSGDHRQFPRDSPWRAQGATNAPPRLTYRGTMDEPSKTNADAICWFFNNDMYIIINSKSIVCTQQLR